MFRIFFQHFLTEQRISGNFSAIWGAQRARFMDTQGGFV